MTGVQTCALPICRTEHNELGKVAAGSTKKAKVLSEPSCACLFGLPGAGKSHCLLLLRRFFEECLGWEDGVQFKFLASQNTMAALVGGTTVHSWGIIPVNSTDAANKISAKLSDGDIDGLYLNALSIRWLILDESSTLSPTDRKSVV